MGCHSRGKLNSVEVRAKIFVGNADDCCTGLAGETILPRSIIALVAGFVAAKQRFSGLDTDSG
jgi:hypothetical protein